ncbi:hypothetical protein [Actinomadura latina]|uniref:Uncharacterized protein n=1 Tax=Actinomadura latina TaxID=163603 RepID=A0A846Z1H1_9ACTN|nr:hypothetical protein [Actinomadura latina]NKZ06121.1 hypothetical protein [Actinomadura latina]
MSALLARLFDDAALFPPERAPMGDALPAYRAAVRNPAAGRLRCPASRFAELRTHLIPEDLLDVVLVADTGIDELPKALDAVLAEPRVRPSAVEIAVPEDADQARAAAVTLARLPSDVPARIEVRPSPGWRDALDRIAAARDRGTPLGAATATVSAAFLSACAERDLQFACADGADRAVSSPSGPGFLNVLLATAQAAAGEPGLHRTLERADAVPLAADVQSLPEDAARAARRLLAAINVRNLDVLRLIGTPDTGKDMSP